MSSPTLAYETAIDELTKSIELLDKINGYLSSYNEDIDICNEKFNACKADFENTKVKIATFSIPSRQTGRILIAAEECQNSLTEHQFDIRRVQKEALALGNRIQAIKGFRAQEVGKKHSIAALILQCKVFCVAWQSQVLNDLFEEYITKSLKTAESVWNASSADEKLLSEIGIMRDEMASLREMLGNLFKV